MGRTCRAVMACFMIFALAACVTDTTPLEPQSKQRDARQARLYFIWPRSAMLRTGTVEIKIDEKVVGNIGPDSYFFVDRQPGTYTLKVEPPFDFTYFETDVQVAGGGTYYYAINVKTAYVPIAGAGVVGVVTVSHPNPGRGMAPKGGGINFATYKLNSLDSAAATAEMAKLDAQATLEAQFR